MFGTLDQILFPAECVVLEIVPHTHYVLPIFKNGSTSLFKQGYRSVRLETLPQLEVLDVFVRDPHKRFIAGVKSYMAELSTDLDPSTALYFIKNFLYLNRHICPQFFWLLNAARFTNAKFRLRPIDELSSLTLLRENQSTPDSNFVQDYFSDVKLKFYNELDEALTVNLINQTVSIQDITSVVKSNYDNLYSATFGTAEEIVDVLRKT